MGTAHPETNRRLCGLGLFVSILSVGSVCNVPINFDESAVD